MLGCHCTPHCKHNLSVFAAGVCFYQKESLPGYSAIFKHPDDELNFCYYLIPYGKEGYCGDVKVRFSTFQHHDCGGECCHVYRSNGMYGKMLLLLFLFSDGGEHRLLCKSGLCSVSSRVDLHITQLSQKHLQVIAIAIPEL